MSYPAGHVPSVTDGVEGLLVQCVDALNDLADNPQTPTTAVLYTSQTLTSAQGGQALANISGATGALGDLTLANTTGSNNHGVFWTHNGGAPFGQIFAQGENQKVVLTSTYITISPNGGVLQLGGNGVHCPIILQSDTGATSGATLKTSASLAFCTTYWNGSASVSRYSGFQGVAVNTSGDVALVYYDPIDITSTGGGTEKYRFTSTALSGAIINAPAGAIGAVGVSVRNADQGIWSVDSTHIRIQALNDGSNYILIGGNTVACGPSDKFKSGYADSATDNAIQIYYGNCGFSVVGSSEWYAASGGARILDFLTAGVRVVSGKDFTLGNTAAAGTITADKTLLIKDAAGVSYKIPCVAA